MYKINNEWPNMEPWGTPQVTFISLEIINLNILIPVFSVMIYLFIHIVATHGQYYLILLWDNGKTVYLLFFFIAVDISSSNFVATK